MVQSGLVIQGQCCRSDVGLQVNREETATVIKRNNEPSSVSTTKLQHFLYSLNQTGWNDNPFSPCAAHRNDLWSKYLLLIMTLSTSPRISYDTARWLWLNVLRMVQFTEVSVPGKLHSEICHSLNEHWLQMKTKWSCQRLKHQWKPVKDANCFVLYRYWIETTSLEVCNFTKLLKT